MTDAEVVADVALWGLHPGDDCAEDLQRRLNEISERLANADAARLPERL